MENEGLVVILRYDITDLNSQLTFFFFLNLLFRFSTSFFCPPKTSFPFCSLSLTSTGVWVSPQYLYISTPIMVSELLRWSLLESLRLPEAKQWLHHCDSLRPGPSREFATLSAMGIQAYQLRPRSAEILQATGIKLAQCYFLSPTQNVYLLKLFSSHFAKTVQIRIFYLVLYSGILLLP